MPTSNSAKKRVRQNVRRNADNIAVKSRIKTLKKKTLSVAGEGNTEETDKAMRECFSALDKAAKKGVHNKRKVAREKSRLSAAVKRAQ